MRRTAVHLSLRHLQHISGPCVPKTSSCRRRPACAASSAGSISIPTRPVDKALITHGHSDHARAGHGAVLATQETLDLMRLRYGENFAGSTQAIAYGETVRLGGARVTFHPAGHVLGSAQIAVEANGLRIVASGDYKDVADPTCAPFELVPCDVFITEATFGLPVFRHGDAGRGDRQAPAFGRAVSRARASRRRLFARQGAARDRADPQGRLRQADLSARRAGEHHALLRQSRHRARRLAQRARAPARPSLPAPSCSVRHRPCKELWSRRFPDPVTAFASGWMRVRARARQRGVELPLVISDHADWDGLTATIAATGAREIWVTHGQEDALVHWCVSRGLEARPLAIVGYGDEDETDGTIAGAAADGEAQDDARASPTTHEPLRRTARSSRLRARPQQQAAADDRLFPRHARSGARLGAGRAHRPLSFQHAKPGMIRALIAERTDPVLFELSYDYVGDLSETVALMWPAPARPDHDINSRAEPSLSQVIETLATLGKARAARSARALARRARRDRPLGLLKLVTGGLRVGVSARLAKTAAAALGDKDPHEIELIWPGLRAALRRAVRLARRPRRQAGDAAIRRRSARRCWRTRSRRAISPRSIPRDFLAEWKWDGIRVQAAAGARADGTRSCRLYSRTGEDISASFPDLVEALRLRRRHRRRAAGRARAAACSRFNVLQQRLNRKTVTPKLLAEFPAHLRAYDLLVDGEEDLRELPFAERRARLEAFIARLDDPRVDLSPLVPFATWDELAAARADPAQPARRRRRSGRRRHAQAARCALRARPAEGPVVEVEARSLHRRRRADVRPARQRQALVVSIPTTPSGSGPRARTATSWCRSARPISASPTRS